MSKYNIVLEPIVRAIIQRGNSILLCKSVSQGYCYLPGGHVESFDSLVETLYKEMNEELGLSRDEISDIKDIGHHEEIFGSEENRRHELNIVYKIHVPESRELISQEDHIEFIWSDINDLMVNKFLPENMIPMVQSAVKSS
jgi:8-oxo-dGTP pyrophosphatase MutT (NUDIX family)